VSQERDVINLTSSSVTVDELAKKQYEAEIAEVLSRDYLTDRLKVALPADVHGEWASNDPVSIANKKLIGFEIDEKYAKDNALHSDGSGAPVIGDTIHMIIPKWKFEIFERQRQKQYDEHHGVRSGKSVEERNFETDADRNGTPATNASKTVNEPISKMVDS
jgi:hypothetical protein